MENIPALLTVTDAAARQLQAFKEKHGEHVRLEINPGGCSGFDMKFAAGAVRADDQRFGPGGAELLIDSLSLSLISGATVDYIDTIGKQGFTVDQIPNLEARCGCGSSFSLA